MLRIEIDDHRIFLIRGLISPADCERLIAIADRTGFEESAIQPDVDSVVREVGHDRQILWERKDLAEALFSRARTLLPRFVEREGRCWELAGLNERLRFYRYQAGEKIALHQDGTQRASSGESSFLSFVVFLNEGCGGETRFYRRDESGEPALSYTVKPETGTALVFDHNELHEGAPVSSGRKYVIRSDVMYRLPAGEMVRA